MMFNRKSKTKPSRLPELVDACERNTPLEIFRATGPGSPPAARGRLLRVTESELHVEQVRDWSGEVALRSGQEIECFFLHQGELHVFRTSVIDESRPVRLNERTSVPGIVLARPKKLDSGQRRGRYRVSFASLVPQLRVKVSTDETLPEMDDESAWTVFALIDASVFGVGLITEEIHERDVSVGQRVFLRFTLPGVGSATELCGEIRRIMPVQASESVRLGIQFLSWPDADVFEGRIAGLEDYLSRFQRDRLRTSAA